LAGSNIARAFLAGSNNVGVQLTSRSPKKLYDTMARDVDQAARLLPPVSADITTPATLQPAFNGASVVVSLVGILHGTPAEFERIQWRGAENVARAAREAGAKLVHISAIGADANSHIPYARTKALGEQAVLEQCPDATIIRPSLVFGPGDEFFAVRVVHASSRWLKVLKSLVRDLLNWPASYLSCRCSAEAYLDSNLSTSETLLVQ
jgi:uncharacterized protein YbjT (DUF2867 family)